MHRLRFVSAASLALILSTAASAGVTIYQDSASLRVSDDFELSPSSFKSDSDHVLNQGTAAQSFLDFVRDNKDVFGLQTVNGETLHFRNAVEDERGITMRFSQNHNRTPVENGDMIALFNRDGKLEAVNTSVMPNLTISVQPEISRVEARKTALASQGYADPAFQDGGLAVVREADGSPALVWKLTAWENETTDKFYQIQVYAAGAKKGQIRQVVNAAHSMAAGNVAVYDGSHVLLMPNPLHRGLRVAVNGKDTFFGKIWRNGADQEAKQAVDSVYGTMTKIRDFYKNEFGRNSYDNQGAEIKAIVNVKRNSNFDLFGLKQNAAWMGPFKHFVFGAGGDELDGFETALDVVGHEFTHAVIGSTSNLEGSGQAGALNEHLADVFGAIIENSYEHPARPFLIGDTVLRGTAAQQAEALRDMEHPEKGLDPQPTSVSAIPSTYGPGCSPSPGNDNCGVHLLNGVPNKAAAGVIKALGWDKSQRLFYRVMTARLRSNSDFADYRNQMLGECQATLSSSECSAVRQAFASVGL